MEHNNHHEKNKQRQQNQGSPGQYGMNNRYGSEYGPQDRTRHTNRYEQTSSHHQPYRINTGPHQQGQYQSGQHYQSTQQQSGQYQSPQMQYGQQYNQAGSAIKNPESNIVPQVKGPEMNDRDFINDILASEKYLTDGFNVFVREASHQNLYKDVKQILMETHDCERDIFNLMFKDGFYSFQTAQQQDIQQTRQQFSKYLNSQDPYGRQGY